MTTARVSANSQSRRAQRQEGRVGMDRATGVEVREDLWQAHTVLA